MAAADIVVKCEEFIDSEVHVEDANNTYFNVYEHHQDSEPENDENRREGSEYENDDIKMQELLREFDLEILYTLLKFGDITYRSLKYISENDINAAIRSIAYRAEFREKLFAWRRDKYGLNDYSVLPPPKNTPMPLGVNNSSNILTTNTNLNRNTNSPAPTMTTTTSTKQAPSSAAPRARRLSAPKTSAAKKARIAANQNASSKRASTASPPPPSSPTPNASRSINSPTQTLSEALSMLQHDNTTTSHPSMDFDDPLCFQPTTSSAAAAATTSASSAIIPTTDSLLFEPQPKMAISKLSIRALIMNAAKHIIARYNKDPQTLQNKDRIFISKYIINHILDINPEFHLKRPHFEEIANIIMSIFNKNTETMSIYFRPSNLGKVSSGKLYNAYCNRKHALSKLGVIQRRQISTLFENNLKD